MLALIPSIPTQKQVGLQVLVLPSTQLVLLIKTVRLLHLHLLMPTLAYYRTVIRVRLQWLQAISFLLTIVLIAVLQSEATLLLVINFKKAIHLQHIQLITIHLLESTMLLQYLKKAP